MFIKENVQDVTVDEIVYQLVPSGHCDKRLRQRGIEYPVIMYDVSKFAGEILGSLKLRENAVLYNLELNYSCAVEAREKEIIIATPFNGKMRAGYNQKVFLIERKDDFFEIISFEEYKKI